MEAVTLPYDLSVNKLAIEDMLTSDQRLASSIELDLPFHHNVTATVSILNDRKQVNRLTDQHRLRKQLQLHGIHTSMTKTFLREYVLFLFQTEVLLIYRSKKQNTWLAANQTQPKKVFQKVSINHKSKELQKVKNLAIRALYALGLDYGMVKCGIVQGNQVVFAHANPSPRISHEMQNKFLQAIEQYTQRMVEKKCPLERIRLGVDPEFVIQSPKGNLVIVSKYLPFRGKIGCDAIWIGNNRSHKPLVELRPDPTPDPRKLVIRIYEGLIMVGRRMNAVPGKWLAGALPYPGFPLGGHIHFSGVKPNFKMLRALDNYLAFPFILVEDQQKGTKRRPKYGFLGDYRLKNYGGFEYRTLPSWLVSPTLTKGVLALAKCIVANYRSLQHNPLAEYELQQAYYQGDKSKAREWITNLWIDLQQLDDYQTYQSYLDPFYRLLISGYTWNEAKDFRKVWRLPPYHQRR